MHVFSLSTFANYGIMYTDYPLLIEDPSRVKQLLYSGRDMGVKNVKGQILEEKEITVEGHPGRYVKVQAGNGLINRRRSSQLLPQRGSMFIVL